MATIGFIGLGVMGYPMAGHLQRAGNQVKVFNRTTAKAEAWVSQYGGTLARSPREAAGEADVVITIVGADNDVRAVVFGEDGALEGMTEGAVLLDHTTASADLARVLHATCKQRGLGFVDAPVSGGEAGAQNGSLTVMCGGDQVDFDSIEPIIEPFASAVTRIGDAGSGQLCKMVNQLSIAGLLQGLSEGIALGISAGLDMDIVLDVISKGAAGSWQMDNRGQTMVADEFDFGFAVDWMRKDLRIAIDQAHSLGASVPIAALVDQLYAQIQKRGGSRWDTSSLIRLLR
jgi:3-hydroxyisobutyrate dehydrogenase-like beta-hydroxyacid dehydrogenase